MSIYLLRGAPASGKSDWVKEHGYEHITIASGKVRAEVMSVESNGSDNQKVHRISQRIVWDTIGRRLDEKLRNGECVILDATNLKTRDIETQVRRADKYGAECYIVDFWSDIACEQCIAKNHTRSSDKQVPDRVIERFYENVQTQTIPMGVRAILAPDEASAMIDMEIQDIDNG